MSVLYPELILSDDSTLCTRCPGPGPGALLLRAGEDRALGVPDKVITILHHYISHENIFT